MNQKGVSYNKSKKKIFIVRIYLRGKFRKLSLLSIYIAKIL